MLTRLRATLAQSDQSAPRPPKHVTICSVSWPIWPMSYEHLSLLSRVTAICMPEACSRRPPTSTERCPESAPRANASIASPTTCFNSPANKPPTNRPRSSTCTLIATAVAADLQAANPGHNIGLRSTPGTHSVCGSPARIHQALLNLAANACHHSETTDEVLISITSDETSVIMEVIDHGPGIDPADHDQIFLPFYRADTSRSRHGRSGAGLGLALAKQIADQHQGTITVETTPGGGATFVLSLPRH